MKAVVCVAGMWWSGGASNKQQEYLIRKNRQNGLIKNNRQNGSIKKSFTQNEVIK
jgi:hypothetical protein